MIPLLLAEMHELPQGAFQNIERFAVALLALLAVLLGSAVGVYAFAVVLAVPLILAFVVVQGQSTSDRSYLVPAGAEKPSPCLTAEAPEPLRYEPGRKPR